MTLINAELHRLMGQRLDISEHLGLLRGLACDADVKRIVEIGFRTGISATALASSGKPVSSYDVADCSQAAARLCQMTVNFEFHRADSLKATLPECDLLHIDSLHTYKQLRAELCRHHDQVTKWIALHDTTTFGSMSQDKTKPGLIQAIEEFLANEGKEWRILLMLTNNNGFTVLQRASSMRP